MTHALGFFLSTINWVHMFKYWVSVSTFPPSPPPTPHPPTSRMYMFLMSTLVLLLKFFISSVMDSVLASSAVDREFELRSGQTKDYKIGICCFSLNTPALRRKSKDWLAQNQDNVSEWSDMSTAVWCFSELAL